MASSGGSKIGQLVDHLIAKLQEVAGEEDWRESDGWVGKWTILGADVERIYRIKDGRFCPVGRQEHYTGEVEMSDDTFLDLVDAAMGGRGEQVFAEKYGKQYIRYRGANWIVDSERFRKVLKRLGGQPVRSVL